MLLITFIEIIIDNINSNNMYLCTICHTLVKKKFLFYILNFERKNVTKQVLHKILEKMYFEASHNLIVMITTNLFLLYVAVKYHIKSNNFQTLKNVQYIYLFIY